MGYQEGVVDHGERAPADGGEGRQVRVVAAVIGHVVDRGVVPAPVRGRGRADLVAARAVPPLGPAVVEVVDEVRPPVGPVGAAQVRVLVVVGQGGERLGPLPPLGHAARREVPVIFFVVIAENRSQIGPRVLVVGELERSGSLPPLQHAMLHEMLQSQAPIAAVSLE